MPVTIEELDNTVRAFYEGRGEQVSTPPNACCLVAKLTLSNSKKLLSLL
jgi:hypothetical protein